MKMLRANPESRFHAASEKWEYPASREAMALYDLYDLQHRSKSKRKPKPYPRPWPDVDKKKTGTVVSASEAVRMLRPTP